MSGHMAGRTGSATCSGDSAGTLGALFSDISIEVEYLHGFYMHRPAADTNLDMCSRFSSLSSRISESLPDQTT